MNIYSILSNIQQNLKAPKNQFNKFGNYSYRSCEDILEGVKPFLANCSLVLNDEIVLIGERYYVKSTATLHSLTDSGSVSAVAYARESQIKKGMDEAQITGAASSYARKYALNALFCIDCTKDADSMSYQAQEVINNQPKKTGQSKKITDQDIALISDLIRLTQTDIKVFYDYYKIDKIEQLTHEQFLSAKSMLEKKQTKTED